MATKKKGRKKGGRKLEFAIYIAGVLLVCLVVFGIVQGIRALVGSDEPEDDGSSSVISETVSSGTETASDSTSSSAASLSENASKDTSSAASSAVSSLAASSQSTSSKDEASAVSSQVSSQASSSQAQPESKPQEYVNRNGNGADELNSWYLLLVNGDNPLPKSWSVNLTSVGSEKLDSRIVKAYKDMVAAAKADGVNIYAISGYRSISTQTRLYNNRVERAKKENPSFTQKQAEDYAATHVARPYTSEHHTGLAIDFNSVEQDFGYTKAGKWLKAHANDYGFVLRYEQNKQGKTGVIWEPWHYRFVGVAHAKRMTQLGYCMEEYVEYLKNGGH